MQKLFLIGFKTIENIFSKSNQIINLLKSDRISKILPTAFFTLQPRSTNNCISFIKYPISLDTYTQLIRRLITFL